MIFFQQWTRLCVLVGTNIWRTLFQQDSMVDATVLPSIADLVKLRFEISTELKQETGCDFLYFNYFIKE